MIKDIVIFIVFNQNFMVIGDFLVYDLNIMIILVDNLKFVIIKGIELFVNEGGLVILIFVVVIVKDLDIDFEEISFVIIK